MRRAPAIKRNQSVPPLLSFQLSDRMSAWHEAVETRETGEARLAYPVEWRHRSAGRIRNGDALCLELSPAIGVASPLAQRGGSATK